MDLAKFVTCLTNDELESLNDLIHHERICRFDVKSFPPLNEDERSILTNFGKVRTMIAYKLRTNQSLYVCKMMVDLVK